MTSKIVAFLAGILIARYLGESLFGVFSFAVAFTGIFGIMSDFGLKVLCRREIARDVKSSNKYLIDSFVAKGILSFISLLVLFVLIQFMDYPSEKQYSIYLAAAATLILSFTDHIRSVFQAHNKMALGSNLNIGRNILRFILTYIVLAKGYGILAVLIVMIAVRLLELAVASVVLHLTVEPIKPKINLRDSKSLMLRALPFGFSSVFILIYYKIDITMLSFMTNDQAVGLYSAAYNLIEGLLFVPLAFTTAITPLASQLFYKSLTRMRNVCAESLRYMAMISLPIAVGTTLFASKIINIIYGKQYFGSVLALQVLIWSIVPTFLHYVLGLFVVSTNNEKQGTINTGSCAILNVLLNLVLIPKYSFVGAAVATIITEAFLVVMNYRVLHRVFESFKLVGSIYKPLAASLIMASVAFVPNAGFALTVPLALVLYIGTLWILGGFSRDDIDMIKDVMRVRNEARKRF